MIEKLPAPCEPCLGSGVRHGSVCSDCQGKGYRLFFVKIEAQRSKKGHINCNAGAQGKITGLPLVERFSHSPAYGE